MMSRDVRVLAERWHKHLALHPHAHYKWESQSLEADVAVGVH